jgi:uncharacterized paraquat-inducible protein A
VPIHVRKERRTADATRLAGGTLACPRCDAPVALAGPVGPADALACPYCAHTGSVRDFLSLAAPSRPARVEVRVISRSRRS